MSAKNLSTQEKLRKLQEMKMARRSSFDSRAIGGVAEKKSVGKSVMVAKRVTNFLKNK